MKVDWNEIEKAVELIRREPMVQRIDVNKKILVYAIPNNDDRKAVIRIDIKGINNI